MKNKTADSRRMRRHWTVLSRAAGVILAPVYRYKYQKSDITGPALVVSNHAANFDPIALGLLFPKMPMHFVVTENLMRQKGVSQFLKYLFEPIARRKGANGAGTAMQCLRALRSGQSVAVFAEGETCWDGRTTPIFPGTGFLAKAAKVKLVTCRLTGGYMTAPRWAKGIRKGECHGKIVRVYAPEEVAGMSSEELDAVIQRDITVDALEEEKKNPVVYKSRRRAEWIENLLFICPACGQYGSMHSRGNTLRCACGMTAEMGETGFFEAGAPMTDLREWHRWQQKRLKEDFAAGKVPAFREPMGRFFRFEDRKAVLIGKFPLECEDAVIRIGEKVFPMAEIEDLAVAMKTRIQFTSGGQYYEWLAEGPRNLIKYKLLREIAKGE